METKEKQRVIRGNYKPVFKFVKLSVKRILECEARSILRSLKCV